MTTPEVRSDRRPRMSPKSAEVTSIMRISPDLIRLGFDCPGIIGADLPFTDHYVKILFIPQGADYTWPYDLAEIRDSRPRDQHPVTRTYTFRHVDTVSGHFDIDFVTHGDQGLAGPWAQRAEIGDTLVFLGPGGAWSPSPEYEHFVLAGDEAAAPAIFAALEALPQGATATAYVEISSEDALFDAPRSASVDVVWVPRNGATHGTRLIEAVRAGGFPEKRTSWFIHGVAEMIRETRRFLFVEGAVDRSDVSISGYWRLGMTEDQWQASKRDFNEENEAEERAASRA
ncbi:siderophore-interacting protein [Corynebacterium pacaense]|uniref:siderophore-interacting protein n=1 Tax=Corynebacterium pacaense TaxID=1816684 RepID=UPI0009BA8638|nr:siderophore-interacting protein [Corynebacterium pacaense]